MMRAQALGGEGWAGFEHLSAMEFASDLIGPELARARLRVADDLELRAVVDAALDRLLKSEAGESMRALAEGVGFQEAIAGAIEALRLAGATHGIVEEALEDPGKRALSRILGDYTSSLAEMSLVDGAELLARAFGHLEGEADALLDWEILLMPDRR